MCFPLAFTLLIATIAIVQATTESLNIKAGEDFVREIDMSAEDHIRVAFKVLSNDPDSLRFWIVFPNGTTRDYGEVAATMPTLLLTCEANVNFTLTTPAQQALKW